MSGRTLGSAILIIALAAGGPALAGDLDWTLRLGAVQLQATDDLQEPGETIELDDDIGLRLSAEFMVREAIGIEPALLVTSHDIEVDSTAIGEFVLGTVDAMFLTTSVNFHVSESDKVDVWLGPMLAYAMWDDVDTELFGSFETDDELAFGVQIGLDVPCGDRWAVTAGASWLSLELAFDEPGATTDLGVDPLMLSAGVSYRF